MELWRKREEKKRREKEKEKASLDYKDKYIEIY